MKIRLEAEGMVSRCFAARLAAIASTTTTVLDLELIIDNRPQGIIQPDNFHTVTQVIHSRLYYSIRSNPAVLGPLSRSVRHHNVHPAVGATREMYHPPVYPYEAA